MTDLELIFSMLGERATTEITRSKDSKGFFELKNDAKEGGDIAGEARKKLEQKTKKTIISEENFLPKNINWSKKAKKIFTNMGGKITSNIDEELY